MLQLLRKLTVGFIVGANILTAVFFVLSSLAPHLDPKRWWFAGFLGLIFPYLLAALLFFIAFWTFAKRVRIIPNIICLLIGIPAIRVFIPFNFSEPFQIEKKENTLRVMTWNIRRFTPFDKTRFDPTETANRPGIVAEIRKYNPDIVCLQEFFTTNEVNNNIRLIQEELGYRWFVFARDNVVHRKHFSGTAVFSKYPIVDSAIIRYPESMSRSTESIIAADIKINSDTLRVYTMHLQSFGFGPRDYTSFGKIKNQQDTNLEASRSLFRKMKQTFYLHALQADFINAELKKSPYTVIACGDLNDVPNSYAYHAIRNNMSDCFLDQGTGFGKTFRSNTSQLLNILPTLRIDYIFADPAWQTHQFSRLQRKLSDHNALVADLVKKAD